MANENTATWLNKFIELLHDSHDGYAECATRVSDPFLQRLFNNLANLRNSMISELETAAKTRQIEPEKTGSTLAAGHRLWIDLKAMITNGNPEAVVNEIKRGENYTIEQYQQALIAEDLSTDIKEIFRRQLEQIQSNLKQVEWRAETTAA